MKLLIVASDPREFSGLLARSKGARPERLPVQWARSAKLGGHDLLLAANGVGATRAGAAVDAAARWFHPEAVISTGFCGALDDSLAIADIVVADCVAGDGRRYPAMPVTGPPFHSGTVCSIDHVARTAEEKYRLHSSSGACAGEMEAAGVASRAGALGLPFYCVKAVTDLAGETMANDFNLALRNNGHFDTIFLLGRALRRPTVCLPELLRLRKRSIRAARTLGDFFADCRL